jgi:hypothetical protein
MENSNFVFQNASLVMPTSLPNDHQGIEYYTAFILLAPFSISLSCTNTIVWLEAIKAYKMQNKCIEL